MASDEPQATGDRGSRSQSTPRGRAAGRPRPTLRSRPSPHAPRSRIAAVGSEQCRLRRARQSAGWTYGGAAESDGRGLKGARRSCDRAVSFARVIGNVALYKQARGSARRSAAAKANVGAARSRPIGVIQMSPIRSFVQFRLEQESTRAERRPRCSFARRSRRQPRSRARSPNSSAAGAKSGAPRVSAMPARAAAERLNTPRPWRLCGLTRRCRPWTPASSWLGGSRAR
jgi:hypothetical protein